ncbi:MAG: hypothetical protein J5I50_09705 [Chitinophagaceae bacterium]|nr:hypothetical protein [Chitinophagaceae bacterium]
MNINTENYEEYFLLYADNELTEAQRRMVETFVAEHPEFKKELDDFLSTVQLPEEEISLGDKSFLFKTEENDFVNDENYEEVFVAYHDNELDESQKRQTEVFISKNPELKDGFNWIGKAKLEPDTSIIFPDKNLLYRRSNNVRILFYRVAVAAVIAGIVSTGLYFLVNSNRGTVSSVTVQTEKPPLQQPQNIEDTPVMPQIEESVETQPQKRSAGIASRQSSPELKIKTVEPDREPVITAQLNEMAEKKDNPDMATTATVQTALETETTAAINTGIVTASEDFSQRLLTVIDEKPEITAATINMEYLNLVLKDDEPDSYVMDIPESIFNKTKVGIFIKKVKRTIDRNNPISRLLNGGE